MPFISSVRGSYGAQGRFGRRQLPDGLTQANPALSALGVTEANASAQPGWYWLNIGGITRQYWVDTQYQGGGWVLVMNSIAGSPLTNNGSTPTYSATTGTDIVANSIGSYATSSGRQNTRFMVGLGIWDAICAANGNTSTKNMAVMTDNDTNPPKTLSASSTPLHRGRFTWTGSLNSSSRFTPSGASGWVYDGSQSGDYANQEAGIYAYHFRGTNNGPAPLGWQTSDNQNGGTCINQYDNNPLWYVGCWDGNIWGGGTYGNYAYFKGSTNSSSGRQNYGAVYIK
jgi:hypothetical protein